MPNANNNRAIFTAFETFKLNAKIAKEWPDFFIISLVGRFFFLVCVAPLQSVLLQSKEKKINEEIVVMNGFFFHRARKRKHNLKMKEKQISLSFILYILLSPILFLKMKPKPNQSSKVGVKTCRFVILFPPIDSYLRC